MLESGGKKVLLTSEEAGCEDPDAEFQSALDKTLENLRKVLTIT
jgi:hypothetical protein